MTRSTEFAAMVTRVAACVCAMIPALAVGSRANGDEVASRPYTVLDRLWIWTHPVGVHDGIDLGGGRQGKSRMTPVQGADYLGVRNVYFIHFPNNPPVPQFRQYAVDFRPMKQVVWSLTGAGGDTSSQGREAVLKLAAEFPNISGFVLDDFLHWSVDSLPDPWLASNSVPFPVSLTLTAANPVAVDRIALVQTSWPSGDYRSKDFAIDVSEDGRAWKETHRGTLANTPGAKADVGLPGAKVSAVRVRILGTHDVQAARSCGLAAVQLWNGDRAVPLESWRAAASSVYSERFAADNVLSAGRSAPAPRADASGNPVPASMTPGELKTLRGQVAAVGRKLPVACVVYTHQISPRILPHVDQVDKIALWTWRSDDLVDLEANFEKIERIVRRKPIVLGCYLFDYGDNKPMTVDRMRRQCELGLKWLHEGRIEGMIFLASNVCDMGLPAVEWTRRWIASVASQPLRRAAAE